jgi:hypothetical protein
LDARLPTSPCPPALLPAESEQEQAGAIGACRILEGRAVWRHVSRDWGALRAMILALLASGGCGMGAVHACLRCLPRPACLLACLPAEADSCTYVSVANTCQIAWLWRVLDRTFCPITRLVSPCLFPAPPSTGL